MARLPDSRSKSADDLRAAHRWARTHHCRPASLKLKCIATGDLCGGGRYKACKPADRTPDVYLEAGCSTHSMELGTTCFSRAMLPNSKDSLVTDASPVIAPPADVTSVAGYCAATQFGASDCSNGESGAWQITGPAASLSTCIRMCACCERCRFVSFSGSFGDCSWHSQCRMTQLQTSPASFVTVEVKHEARGELSRPG